MYKVKYDLETFSTLSKVCPAWAPHSHSPLFYHHNSVPSINLYSKGARTFLVQLYRRASSLAYQAITYSSVPLLLLIDLGLYWTLYWHISTLLINADGSETECVKKTSTTFQTFGKSACHWELDQTKQCLHLSQELLCNYLFGFLFIWLGRATHACKHTTPDCNHGLISILCPALENKQSFILIF